MTVGNRRIRQLQSNGTFWTNQSAPCPYDPEVCALTTAQLLVVISNFLGETLDFVLEGTVSIVLTGHVIETRINGPCHVIVPVLTIAIQSLLETLTVTFGVSFGGLAVI